MMSMNSHENHEGEDLSWIFISDGQQNKSNERAFNEITIGKSACLVINDFAPDRLNVAIQHSKKPELT